MNATNEELFSFPFHEYVAILKRRRMVIIQSVVLVTLVGLVVTLMSKPVYRATAELLVDGPSYNLNTVDSTNPLSDLFPIGQEQTVQTQVEVLQAQPLLDKVFQSAGDAQLSVQAIGDTNVIEITSEANDPRVAAAAPNTLADLYIQQDTDDDLGDITRAREFVQKQSVAARQRLFLAEDALRAFKEQNHVVELTKDRDDQLAKLDGLSTAQEHVQGDLASAQAEMAAQRQLLGREPAVVSSVTQSTNTSIASLKAQIASIQVDRQGLVQPGGYTSRAPRILALDAQIATLKAQLRQQQHQPLVSSVTKSSNGLRETMHARLIDLQTEEASLKAQDNELNTQITQAKAQLGHFADYEVALGRLTREHDAAQADDKRYADSLADLSLREKARHATAHVIERAEAPSEPIRPKKVENLLIAFLLSLFIGITLALLQEFLDDRINAEDDARLLLGLPSLGRVPALSKADIHLLPQMRGFDPAAESYRTLRTNIQFAGVDSPIRTLLVTSSVPGEGKTTTAVNLAFAMAMDGKKVILVDTDLRRPALHKMLDLPPVPGLTNVLLGQSPLDQTLLEYEDLPNLNVLPCGSTPPNPAELINSNAFINVRDELVKMADVVIFDSSPLLAAADPQILSARVDGVILVLETGSTKKAAAKHALSLLRHARANVLGLAFNKANDPQGEGYYYYYALSPDEREELADRAPLAELSGAKEEQEQ